MKYLCVILAASMLSCISCNVGKNGNGIYQNADTSLKIPFAYSEKKPIILNKTPTDIDVDSFMIDGTSGSYKRLATRYMKVDTMNELLFYAIVAVDKFKIARGYYNIAGCLTNYFSYMTIGHHSKEIATHYLIKGLRNNDETCSEVYVSLDKHLRNERRKLWIPKKNLNDPIVEYKANSLMGNIDDYNELKRSLVENKQYERLLYYSYIMADRYDYKPARKDVIDILRTSYQKYGLGEFGEDAKYFCGFFESDR